MIDALDERGRRPPPSETGLTDASYFMDPERNIYVKIGFIIAFMMLLVIQIRFHLVQVLRLKEL